MEFALLDGEEGEEEEEESPAANFATADLRVSEGGVEVLCVRSSSLGEEREGHGDALSLPIHLVANPTKGDGADYQGAVSTPLHSITSTTSDLPPSPVSLQSASWSGGSTYSQQEKEGGGQAQAQAQAQVQPIRLPLPCKVSPLPMGCLRISCPPQQQQQQSKGDLVSQDALLLKVAGPPSPPLLPPLPMSPAEVGLAPKKGHLHVETASKEVQTSLGEESEKKVSGLQATKSQQTAHTNVAERGVQIEEKARKQSEGGGGSRRPSKADGRANNNNNKRRTYSSSRSSSSSVVRTTSDPVPEPVLADAQVQTEEQHWEEAGGMKPQNSDEETQIQDDVVARVLMEHVGTAFALPDPRRTTNYLDLSKIGEEGETPASDEIWLAVEDGEEIDKGFLSSSDDEERETDGRRLRGVEMRSLPSTVETDKLSTAATMGGHVALRGGGRGEGGGSDGANRAGGGDDREDPDLLDGLDEEAMRSEEMYLGVTARLQGVLSEELLPIQDTLAVTEKSVVVLAEKLQRMEGVLHTLAEKIGTRTIAEVMGATREGDGVAEEEEKSLESILHKIQQLSNALSSVTTANKLQEDNHCLRQDLERYRHRERHLLSRIEMMEKKLSAGSTAQRSSNSSNSSNSASSRPVSFKGNSRRQEESLIDKSEERTSKQNRNAREHIEVGRAIQLLAKEASPQGDPGQQQQQHPKPKKTSSFPDGSADIPRQLVKFSSLKDTELCRTDVQIARSDNAILRQDLQVFRERESQLVRRNKELEEKLLIKRTSSLKKINNAHSTISKSAPEAAQEPSSPLLLFQTAAKPSFDADTTDNDRKTDLDINAQFTLPGKGAAAANGERHGREKKEGRCLEEKKEQAVAEEKSKKEGKEKKENSSTTKTAKKEAQKVTTAKKELVDGNNKSRSSLKRQQQQGTAKATATGVKEERHRTDDAKSGEDKANNVGGDKPKVGKASESSAKAEADSTSQEPKVALETPESGGTLPKTRGEEEPTPPVKQRRPEVAPPRAAAPPMAARKKKSEPPKAASKRPPPAKVDDGSPSTDVRGGGDPVPTPGQFPAARPPRNHRPAQQGRESKEGKPLPPPPPSPPTSDGCGKSVVEPQPSANGQEGNVAPIVAKGEDPRVAGLIEEVPPATMSQVLPHKESMDPRA